jgi:hypothetical protein
VKGTTLALSPFRSTALLGVIALTASGCGLFSSKAATSVAKVDVMQSSIEKVHVESELAQQRVRDSADLLTTLVTGNYQGQPADVYVRLVAALEASEKQADKMRDAIDKMKQSATPVFENWQNDLLRITNLDLRRRSEERLDQTRERFDELVSASRAAETGVDAFNQGARDITLFLGSDFNPAAISAIEDDARSVDNLSVDVDQRLRRTQTAAQEYMAASGVPLENADALATPPAPSAGGAPAQPAPRTQTPAPRRGGG